MPKREVTQRNEVVRPSGLKAPRFVGRDAEARLVTATLAASPALVLVEGEAGIGKSRLLREVLSTMPAQAGRILVAACPPFRRPFTLGPIVDAVRQATGNVTGLRLSALAGALRPLFPEWADGLPPAPEPLEDASAARHRLFRALCELLARLGTDLLVVEDAHWADEATVEFLLFLAARPPQQVSLLITCRPDDVPAGSLLRRLSSRLSAGTACARIALAPLDVTSTESLVSSMLGGETISGEFAAFLHQHTDGLPLAVEESVWLLHDRADLIRHAGQWERRGLAELVVPPTVRDSVLERAERLSAPGQMMLHAAAVLSHPASEAVLSAVAGLAPAQARAGLATALGCGLLHEDEHGMVAFRHVLASKAVYDAIPSPQRRRLHLSAARALEETSRLPVSQLARHFREARMAQEWFHYAEQAADLALAAGDDKTAAAMLHDIVTHPALPASAVVRLARSMPIFGLAKFTYFHDVTHALRLAIDDNSLTPVQRAEGRYQLGRFLLSMGEHSAGVAELEQAIPGLDQSPVEAARAMVRLSWPGATTWPAAVHRRWLERADAITNCSPMTGAERLELTVNRATALLNLGEEAGWALATGIPETAATPRGAHQIGRGCLNIGDAAILWGRYAEARQRLKAGLELAVRQDYPWLRVAALTMLSHLDWFTGSWSGLAQRIAALPALDDAGPYVLQETVMVRGLLEAAAGARTAGDRLRQAVEESRRYGDMDSPLEPAAALARVQLAGGDVGDALSLTTEPIQVVTVKGIWLWATDIAPVRVQALAAAGRCEEAARLVGAFAKGMRKREAPAPLAALATSRAILAQSRGDMARAGSLFARAAKAWQALPRPYEALLAQEQQALCLILTGQPETGLSLLADILQGMSDLGARGDAGRVTEILREHGVRARQRRHTGRRGYGHELSPSELDVVRLVGAGWTSRKIGEALSRSPRTVQNQLTSAMHKLGVSSRTELAIAAVEARITPAGHLSTVIDLRRD